jgi:hypothetical protein
LSDLYVKDFTALFGDTSALMDDVRTLMHRWAGVDGVALDSRGPNIDARDLAFLEAFTGQDFLQRGAWRDPGSLAALELEEAFHIAQSNIYARLTAQGAGGELFTGDWFYNIAADSFEGITGLDSSALAALEAEGMGVAQKDVFWGNVVRMVEYAAGTDNLPAADRAALDAAIANTDASLSLDAILATLPYGAPEGVDVNGTSDADILTGGAGWDALSGGTEDAINDNVKGGKGLTLAWAA